MFENPVLKEESVIQVEEVVLPQIVSIKQASQRMGAACLLRSPPVQRGAGDGVPVRRQVVCQPWKNGGIFQQRNDLCLIVKGCRRGWRHPKNLRCNLLYSP